MAPSLFPPVSVVSSQPNPFIHQDCKWLVDAGKDQRYRCVDAKADVWAELTCQGNVNGVKQRAGCRVPASLQRG